MLQAAYAKRSTYHGRRNSSAALKSRTVEVVWWQEKLANLQGGRWHVRLGCTSAGRPPRYYASTITTVRNGT